MKISVEVSPEKIMMMAMRGDTESDLAEEVAAQIKRMVLTKLEDSIDGRVEQLVSKILTTKIVSIVDDIVKVELRKKIVSGLKESLDEVDYAEILSEIIATNVLVKATIDMK